MDEEQDIILQIKWKGKLYAVTCNPFDSILSLKLKLESETNVLVEKQKLTLRFKDKPEDINDALLSSIILPKNKIIMMIGTPESEVYTMPTEEEQKKLLPPEIIKIDENLLEEQYKPVNLAKIEKRKQSYQPKYLNEPREGKKLLVLDIDYTIYDHRSTAERIDELIRPYLHEFLTNVYEHYDIIIWSATSLKWIELKMREFGILSNPNYKIVSFFDIGAMISVYSKKYGLVNVKPLPVIWHVFKGIYSQSNTIMFDDIRRNFLMNPQNGLRIEPYKNAILIRDTDRELVHLEKYLLSISNLSSFSELNHKKWKRYKKISSKNTN